MKSNHKRTPFAEVLNHLDRKYSNFDGTGFQEPYYDYIEGAPEEPTTRVYQADPYQIIVENPDKIAHKAILFGKNKFSSKPNFGSDPEIKITMGQPALNMSSCWNLLLVPLSPNSCELNRRTSCRFLSSSR